MMTISLASRAALRGARLLAAAALAVALTAALAAGPAHAELSFSQFSAGFEDPATQAPVTQAGAHADFFISFAFDVKPDPQIPINIPTERLKDVQVDLPPGFYGNPQAVPYCDMAVYEQGQGFCSAEAQVGVAEVQADDPNQSGFGLQTVPIYNVAPATGETAALSFSVLNTMVRLSITPRTDGDYGLRSTVENLPQALPIYSTKITLWGVPADPVHDSARVPALNASPIPSTLPLRPFLTLPTICQPATISLAATSWEHPSTPVTESQTTPITGCDALQFDAGITARPVERKPDTPSGFDVDLTIPQDESWSSVGTPQLRKAVVTLPEGMAISPASAAGLEGCSDAQMAIGTNDEPTCPDASKIGTVSITTPLLPDPLEGDIILGSPKPGHLFRLFLVAHGPGMLLKLPGEAKPDASTGQLTTTFDDTPQLPFSKLHLHFKGGPRAPLATPQSCGTKTTTATLTPWTGAAVAASDAFDITGCSGGFAPSFEAGTLSPGAGAFSPFTMTIRRNDGDQEISKIAVDLPPGLLGILAGIPQCPEGAAAAGTCDASTQLGTTTVEAGSGSEPLPLTGKVFLAGPYKGAPYSLSIVVQAIAGPFDLGTVVVRAPLNIDAAAGKVAVPADPLPTILQGIPLRLRTINITLDRPGFMFNATNCTPMTLGATLTSVGGAVATPSSRYQAVGCAGLPLNPRFSLRLTDRSQLKKKGGHPGVVADLSQRPGQAGLKKVEVTLPSGVGVALANLQSFCKKADAAARNCPAASIVGQASAKTAALPAALSGPVYLVEGSKKDPKTGKDVPTLPRLWLKLEGGGVPLDLWADTNVVRGRVITTFATIPDAPISSFQLKINGGAKGILQTSRDVCASSPSAKAEFDGQNGARVTRTLPTASDCAPRIAKTKVSSKSVALTVSGIGAGKLAVSGVGVTSATKTITRATVATVVARLSAATRRQLAAAGKIRVRLTVVFAPKSGKAVTLHKTVTIRRSSK